LPLEVKSGNFLFQFSDIRGYTFAERAMLCLLPFELWTYQKDMLEIFYQVFATKHSGSLGVLVNWGDDGNFFAISRVEICAVGGLFHVFTIQNHRVHIYFLRLDFYGNQRIIY